MNLGAIALGVLVTVLVVERFLAHLEQRRWKPVLEVTAHYVERISNGTTTAYREALGIAEAALPRELIGPESTDHQRLTAMAQFINQTLLPSVGNLANLDVQGWQTLVRQLNASKSEGKETLLLMGSRLPPEVVESILLLRRAIDSVESTYAYYRPILGVPDSVPVVIEPGTLPARVFEPFRNAPQAAFKFKAVGLEIAEDDARKVLLEAMKMLNRTLALYSQDSWWQQWTRWLRRKA